jgi:hypothetical protein
MIDETTKFNRAKGYYNRVALAGNTDGAFKELVAFNKQADNFMAQGGRIGLVEGGLLKIGPNKGKYVLRSKIDGERARRFFDTKKEFDEAVKISKANTGGGARDQSKRISEPTTTEIEISEKVYGDKYNKKGEELWKFLTGRERGGIRQGTTTGGKKGPTEGLGVTEEGKPVLSS